MVDLKHIVTIRWWSDGGTCTTVQHISGRKTNHSKLTRPFSTQMGSKPLIVLYIYIYTPVYLMIFCEFFSHAWEPCLENRQDGLWLWDGDDGGNRALYRYPQYHMPRGTKILSSLESPLRLQWQKLRVAAEWSLLDVVSQDANRWRAVESIAKS
jgi:hypothetical protein